MYTSDFIIIGAGIAGSSAAAELSQYGRVILLERETHPGYHSTGRSAACYEPADGSGAVRKMILAGGSFLSSPPEGFSATPLMRPRGSLCLFTEGQEHFLKEQLELMASVSSNIKMIGIKEILKKVPVVRDERVVCGIYSDITQDIDVHALHSGYLKKMKSFGGEMHLDSEVVDIRKSSGGLDWIVSTISEEYRAPILINASGAWCDIIAEMAGVGTIGIQPRRRNVVIVNLPPNMDASNWPMVYGMDPLYYFKPDADRLIVSPMDQIPSEPCDARPEELDIAIAIDRLESMTTLKINRPEHSWAGLRSFVHDEMLVSGFDSNNSGFYWLIGQGGYGIETSPAMGAITSALVLGKPFPEWIAAFGIKESDLSPNRL